MIRRVAGPAALAALALTLVSCASNPPAPAPAPAPAPQPQQAPQSTPPPQSPAPQPHDMCGAYEAQKLVGQPRTEIPIPVLPALQRVACATCPVTQDFNPRRLNFFYDAETGIIKEVRCG